MLSAWTPLAPGDAGIRTVLRRLVALKDYYGRLPEIRAAALVIAGSGVDHDEMGHVARLFSWVQRKLVYVSDPFNAELIVTPDVLLVEIDRDGSASGDCDDHVLLYAALAESLGIRTTPVAVKTPDSAVWNHVIAVSTLDDGRTLSLDLIAKGIPQPVYSETLVL